MGHLSSPETIWMCVCVTTADGLPALSLNAAHSQVGAKTCPLKERQDPAALQLEETLMFTE